ncbi:VOC family protein [bacterium]|nr:VOC family protein [bacterium]
MPTTNPYLFFNGNCREAMEFYKNCLGGELQIMTYADAPPADKGGCPDGALDMETMKDKVMHACIMGEKFGIMGSDNPSGKTVTGDNVTININADSVEQLESFFQKLSAGGKPVFPPHDAFWGNRFAMLTDKYGFHWMLNCPLKRS